MLGDQTREIPVVVSDPINTAILSVAEDCVAGFYRYPFSEIARQSGLDEHVVITRLKAMCKAGVIRRVRQTLLATKLAHGALIAWRVPENKLESAYQWLAEHDPFTGHVVIRSTSAGNPGADYRLWTTLKVPIGSGSLESHCDLLKDIVGASDYVLLPTVGVFSLGVGHMRRRALKPGDKKDRPAKMERSVMAELTEQEWSVLLCLKEELREDEFLHDTWVARARSLTMTTEKFCDIATGLNKKRVIGRFATFLEHTKVKSADGPVTRFNGLFHWAVPEGMEEQAGGECGRHLCMTHCYWRAGGASFGGAQIMGVVHGLDEETVMAHKSAIDDHLRSCGIPILHTAVFQGIKSEIKPSEISPEVYVAWAKQLGVGVLS